MSSRVLVCNQDMLKDFKSPGVGFYQSFCQSLSKYTPFTHAFLCGSEGFSVLKARHCCSPNELVQIIGGTAGQELMQLMGTHGRGLDFGFHGLCTSEVGSPYSSSGG